MLAHKRVRSPGFFQGEERDAEAPKQDPKASGKATGEAMQSFRRGIPGVSALVAANPRP
jgi:hypothetical protein